MTIAAFENVEVKVKTVTLHEGVCEPVYVWNRGRSAQLATDTFITGSYWHRPHGTEISTTSKPPEVNK
jgi:hypothetical protein